MYICYSEIEVHFLMVVKGRQKHGLKASTLCTQQDLHYGTW